ncbi:MAG: 4Fe-4S binding protein [Candidatus Bathyarchaeia archaeon]
MHIITYYGYADASGEYYIAIDSEKCNGCGDCVWACPQSALEIAYIMVDIEEKPLAAVKEEHRKKLKYTCSPCKPEKDTPPCTAACKQKAITCIWKSGRR